MSQLIDLGVLSEDSLRMSDQSDQHPSDDSSAVSSEQKSSTDPQNETTADPKETDCNANSATNPCMEDEKPTKLATNDVHDTADPEHMQPQPSDQSPTHDSLMLDIDDLMSFLDNSFAPDTSIDLPPPDNKEDGTEALPSLPPPDLVDISNDIDNVVDDNDRACGQAPEAQEAGAEISTQPPSASDENNDHIDPTPLSGTSEPVTVADNEDSSEADDGQELPDKTTPALSRQQAAEVEEEPLADLRENHDPVSEDSSAPVDTGNNQPLSDSTADKPELQPSLPRDLSAVDMEDKNKAIDETSVEARDTDAVSIPQPSLAADGNKDHKGSALASDMSAMTSIPALSAPADDGSDDNNDDKDAFERQRLLGETSPPPPPSQPRPMDNEDGTTAEVEEDRCQLLAKAEMHENHHGIQQPGSADSSSSDLKSEDTELVKTPLQRPVRTCIVLCIAFLFVYTANLAIQNLQSSLHQAAGLGVTSLAVLYGAIIVFGSLSPMVIRFLNAKRTLVVAFVCHLLYTLSNFYPTFPTLLTSSLLLGAVAGPMWTAQGLYCTAAGLAYAGIKQMETHGALSLFNGIFFAFYESTQITGNLIASLVLMKSSYNETSIQDANKICGASVCPDTEMNSTKIEQPEKKVVYILMSIYLACNVIGLLLTAFALPPLPRHQEIQSGENSLKKSTVSCLSMLLVPKMVLLLPFFMAQAMNSGILLAEYSQKFVSCAVGIQWVGYVMTAFGVLTSAQAVGLNYAAKYLGRRVLFTAAALADLSVNIAMLLWDPTGTNVRSLFILPCISGFAEGIFQAQFNSLVAMVFPEKVTAAFATYHTSKATAFTLTFVLARFLCLNQRLYVSISLSVLGLLGWIIVEVMLHRNKKQEQTNTGDNHVE